MIHFPDWNASRKRALCSALIPGLGQVMNGQERKGEYLLLGVFLGFFVFHIISILISLVIWFYAIYDAYQESDKLRDTQPPKKPSRDEMVLHIYIACGMGILVIFRGFILDYIANNPAPF